MPKIDLSHIKKDIVKDYANYPNWRFLSQKYNYDQRTIKEFIKICKNVYLHSKKEEYWA